MKTSRSAWMHPIWVIKCYLICNLKYWLFVFSCLFSVDWKAHCSYLSQNNEQYSLKANYVFQYRTWKLISCLIGRTPTSKEYEIIPPPSTLMWFPSWFLWLWHFCIWNAISYDLFSLQKSFKDNRQCHRDNEYL